MQIQSTDSVKVQGVKVLVYGRAGTGKTRLAATAPAPFIFSAENGLLSLRKERIPFTTINTLKDLDEAYKWLTTSKEARNFQTFSLDSISEIAEIVLANELGRTKDPRQAYGEMAKVVFDKFRKFRDFNGPHILFISKEDFVKDEQIGGMYFGPSFPGKQLVTQAPYFFDMVFRMTLLKDKEGKNFSALQTQPDSNVNAKDRSGALDFWEEPNLTKIFNKVLA